MIKKIATYFFAAAGLAALLVVAYAIHRMSLLKNAPSLPLDTYEVPLSNENLPTVGYEYPDQPITNSANGVLTIAELGVSVPATGVLQDLVYSRFPTYRDYESNVYGLSTGSLLEAVKNDGDGDCRPQRGALGLLQISDTGEKIFESTIVVQLANGKYLVWESPQDRCVASEPGYALWQELMDEIRVAVRQAHAL